MKQIRWVNAQLHNHTVHSDGKATVPEMVEALANRGAELIALTDHNSVSGHPQLLPACREKGVHGLRGIEVTTFYGHVLGLGVKEYIDWRGYSPECPEKICRDIRKLGGLAGLAHPIRIGYPAVTGCAWLYHISDYDAFDYIEILNTSDFQFCRNDLAIELWINRLRAGNTHLAAVSGLDYHARPWHGKETVTWLGVDSGIADPESAALDAIRSQRAIVCKDSLIRIEVRDSYRNRQLPGSRFSGTAQELLLDTAGKENLTVVLWDQNGSQILGTAQPSMPLPRTERFLVIALYRGAPDVLNLEAISNPFFPDCTRGGNHPVCNN